MTTTAAGRATPRYLWPYKRYVKTEVKGTPDPSNCAGIAAARFESFFCFLRASYLTFMRAAEVFADDQMWGKPESLTVFLPSLPIGVV